MMRKKLLPIALLLLFLLVADGCGTHASKKEEASNGNESTQDTEQDVEWSAVYSDFENALDDSSSSEENEYSADEEQDIEASLRPFDFEHVLLYTTDVVKARYEGFSVVTNTGYYTCFLEFELLSTLRGDINETKIVIQVQFYTVDDTDDMIYGREDSSDFDLSFVAGEKYLLLLQRYRSVYQDEDVFTLVCSSLVIPIDDEGRYSWAGAMMQGSPLTECCTEDTKKWLNDEDFEDVLLRTIEDNRCFFGFEYVSSTDLLDILNGSEYVLEVFVLEQEPDETIQHGYGWYSCEVIASHKGKVEHSVVSIKLCVEEVEIGNSYIVLANSFADGKKTMLILSSKNSFRSCAELEEIISALEKAR